MNRFSIPLCLLIAVLFVACSSEDAPTTALAVDRSATASLEESTAVPVTEKPTPAPSPTPIEADPYAALREEMVQSGIIDWGVDDETVIAAMLTVPRHEFVPEEYLNQAYENHPLPIGLGQTISQPYIVAKMTEAIEVSPGDRVLEIGTGSGYQAAVLAEVVDQVYTVEIIGDLLDRASETHERLGYHNISTLHGDGYFGWEEHAPYDAIIVTAAPDHIPIPLVQQLKTGGRMIIPVGPVGGFQRLWLITRISEEEVQTVDLGGVSFVPLTRETR
ncbi:MAG: protein-L-isoaspartate(D-aspartate) O-methyltransferase [Candidatus Promineifilaceae bacterium]